MRNCTVSPWLRRSLQWWLQFIEADVRLTRTPKDYTRQVVRSWTDAAGKTRKVAVILLARGVWWYTEAVIPKKIWARFLVRKNHGMNLQELLAVIIAMATFEPELWESLWLEFCDSTAAMGALLNGGTDDCVSRDANICVSKYWMETARIKTEPHLERVESKANPSDQPSRDVKEIVERL